MTSAHRRCPPPAGGHRCYKGKGDWTACAGDHLPYPPRSRNEILSQNPVCISSAAPPQTCHGHTPEDDTPRPMPFGLVLTPSRTRRPPVFPSCLSPAALPFDRVLQICLHEPYCWKQLDWINTDPPSVTCSGVDIRYVEVRTTGTASATNKDDIPLSIPSRPHPRYAHTPGTDRAATRS